MGLTIAQMKLSPIASQNAELLVERHGDLIVFTSGRRDLKKQAEAMAWNVTKDRDWIGATYLVGLTLQDWVNHHPELVRYRELADGLYRYMLELGPDYYGRISRHLSGDAWDIDPIVDVDGHPTADGGDVIETIRSLDGLDKFLTKEGRLVRWHAQFLVSAA